MGSVLSILDIWFYKIFVLITIYGWRNHILERWIDVLKVLMPVRGRGWFELTFPFFKSQWLSIIAPQYLSPFHPIGTACGGDQSWAWERKLPTAPRECRREQWHWSLWRALQLQSLCLWFLVRFLWKDSNLNKGQGYLVNDLSGGWQLGGERKEKRTTIERGSRAVGWMPAVPA